MNGTNRELKALMRERDLTMREVAGMLDVSLSTVQSWRVSPTSERYRKAPTMAIELLKLKLGCNTKGARK